jgi:hypothetical protein
VALVGVTNLVVFERGALFGFGLVGLSTFACLSAVAALGVAPEANDEVGIFIAWVLI